MTDASVETREFPVQGWLLQRKVSVYMGGDMTKPPLWGTVVRHDIDDPHHMIIALSNGRYIFAYECTFLLPAVS
jgi:hypothetical protein